MKTKRFIILAFIVFGFNFSLCFAQGDGKNANQYHPSVQKIIKNFTDKYPNGDFTDSALDFSMGGKDFFAIYISEEPDDTNRSTQYSSVASLVSICNKNSDGSVSDCRRVDLGGLTGFPSFAVTNNFITLELEGEDTIYYLTLVYTKGDFYLHQFAYTYEGLELYQQGAMQNKIYYRVDREKGYNVKMREMGFKNLYPERYESSESVIKKYPALRGIVDFMAGHLSGDLIDIRTSSFKMDDNDFLAAKVTSMCDEDQIPSTTSSWCIPIMAVLVICDDFSGSLSNCRQAKVDDPVGCGGEIVNKNNFITFEDSTQDRHGNVNELYYTFKYTKGDFYLHKYSTLSGSADDEKPENMKEYYVADPKKGYDLHFNDVDFHELEDKYNKNKNENENR